MSWLMRPKRWPEPAQSSWRAATFAVIDIETTGLDLQHDEILSLGIAHITHARVEPNSYYSTVRPRCHITTEAMKVHGLTAEAVAKAPELGQVIEEACAHLQGQVIVAHAAWIERAFLDRALAPRGERLPRSIVDTAALARAAGFGRELEGEPSLEWLARTLELPVHTPHHALGDAATTAIVLLALATRLERREGALTTADLVALSSRFGR